MAVNKLYIVATGLSWVDKTIFVQRIISRELVEIAHPTLGVSTEICGYEGYILQIFDLGGHESLRRHNCYAKISDFLILKRLYSSNAA